MHETVPGDSDLISQAQAGDREAFGILVGRYQNDLHALARQLVSSGEEAEDLAADAFLRAWRDISRFRGESSFKTWLWRILINLCRSHLRRRYLQRRLFFWQEPATEDEDCPSREAQWPDRSSGSDPERSCDRVNLQRRIREARSRLSPREQEVFALKFDQDMKITEIGHMLLISENTVKVLLFRAAKKMASALKDYQHEV